MNTLKTIYFVDVDGVLLDMCTPFVEYWNERVPHRQLESNPPTYLFGLKSGEPLIADLIKHLDTFQAETDDYEVCDQTAVETLGILHSSENTHVHILTAYPLEYKDNRIANLTRHGFKYHEITLGNGSNGKFEVIQAHVEKHGPNVRIVVIDDNPKLAKKLLENGFLHNNKVELWVPLQWKYTAEIREFPGAEHINFYNNLAELLNS